MARVLGFTQDITACDHCGKTELKGTYAVEGDNAITYYGSVCVGRVFGKQEGKFLRDRSGHVSLIRRAQHRSAYALRVFGWGTKNGWIVDGIGRKVIEAA